MFANDYLLFFHFEQTNKQQIGIIGEIKTMQSIDCSVSQSVKKVTWENKFMDKQQRRSLINRLENYRDDITKDCTANNNCTRTKNRPSSWRRINESNANNSRPRSFSHSDEASNESLNQNINKSCIRSKASVERRHSVSSPSNKISDNSNNDRSWVRSKEAKERRHSISFSNTFPEDPKTRTRRHSSMINTYCDVEIFVNPIEDTLRFHKLVKTYSDKLVEQSNCDSDNLVEQSNNCDSENLENYNEEMLLDLY